MISKTSGEYKQVMARCKTLFAKKTYDYGTAWLVLRLPSITDQIWIKAQRVRTVQKEGVQKVADTIQDELVGIINYCVMALIQIHLQNTKENLPNLTTFDELEPIYDDAVLETLCLLENKNHDYGEAWRSMRVGSIIDIILMKLLRVKQIEDHAGKSLVSEGVKANYQDIINYAVFALIRLKNNTV